MECQNCHQPVEAGAAFCGNCGQPLQNQNPLDPQAAGHVALAGAQPNLPDYAIATPAQHVSETKVLLTLLCGIVGIVGALFIPLAGVMFGITGLVLGTTARINNKHWYVRIGLILSSLALLTGLATWAYAVRHDPKLNHSAISKNDAPVATSADLATPCYSVNFVDKLNINHSDKSCDMKAFNGTTLDTSSNAYKVYASQSQIVNVASFTNLAKAALEKDIKNSLPNFTVDNERVSGFAGSPSYTINASDKSGGVAIVETAVYHQTKQGDDIFILVHAVAGNTTDLHILEAQWQWK